MIPICADGIRVNSEQCDDGNEFAGDGDYLIHFLAF